MENTERLAIVKLTNDENGNPVIKEILSDNLSATQINQAAELAIETISNLVNRATENGEDKLAVSLD